MPAFSLPHVFSGLDYLASAVLLLDARYATRYANSATENLLAVSGRSLIGRPLDQVMYYSFTLRQALENAVVNDWSYTGQNVEMRRADGEILHLNCTVTPLHCAEAPEICLLMELFPIDQQLKASREVWLIEQQEASRELIRNLAHEVKNPLGGIRGAAQLLERELAQPEYREYTQIIIQEADRLQNLMQRLLSPHRTAMQIAAVNIHDVLERVRSLLLLEFPATLTIRQDYDASLPELAGDREQLIQVFLNIARNAAQALSGEGEIVLQTRVARQVTLAQRRVRLALEIAVIDNGPGIPEALQGRIFFPLVSGRPEGSGLGLTLAQSFVQQHQGCIECESRPGHTCFRVRLPLEAA
ncbi:MAG: PAS domain-containing sensor histidine kinase [Zoogloeaceae bacterium]|jgi:two-component system nitrogen regulation sensor histidine kinase GlnL|nr:PAS domain-containing sensor histidine kinase [Zoogloeaceae bacterium]